MHRDAGGCVLRGSTRHRKPTLRERRCRPSCRSRWAKIGPIFGVDTAGRRPSTLGLFYCLPRRAEQGPGASYLPPRSSHCVARPGTWISTPAAPSRPCSACAPSTLLLAGRPCRGFGPPPDLLGVLPLMMQDGLRGMALLRASTRCRPSGIDLAARLAALCRHPLIIKPGVVVHSAFMVRICPGFFKNNKNKHAPALAHTSPLICPGQRRNWRRQRPRASTLRRSATCG